MTAIQMRKKKKMKKYVMLFMVLLLISIPCVMAGTGLLKISPSYTTTSPSPTDFTVWCNSGSSYDVEILLVVTEDCWSNMIGIGAVTVEHEGIIIADFDQTEFQGPVTGMGGVYIPPSGATNGARYTVASLKDHLDYGMTTPLGSDDAIYWVKEPLVTAGNDFDPLGESPEVLTITLISGEPRMLVYLMGRSENNGDLLDMRIPPTMAGFMVPEVAIGSIMAVASMFTALGLYTYKKKHTAPK